MSKILTCIFPYMSKPNQDDIKNTAFIRDTSNSSICELSYHHVESVSKKALQKRIKKLEKDRAALVEMMIDQHENYKNSVNLGSSSSHCQRIQKSPPNYYEYQKKIGKLNKNQESTQNYYKKIQNKSNKQPVLEESITENTYAYISFHC